MSCLVHSGSVALLTEATVNLQWQFFPLITYFLAAFNELIYGNNPIFIFVHFLYKEKKKKKMCIKAFDMRLSHLNPIENPSAHLMWRPTLQQELVDSWKLESYGSVLSKGQSPSASGETSHDRVQAICWNVSAGFRMWKMGLIRIFNIRFCEKRIETKTCKPENCLVLYLGYSEVTSVINLKPKLQS